MCKWLKRLFSSSAPNGGELHSPRNDIPSEDIVADEQEQKITIYNVSRIWRTTVADTNSMEPAIDWGHEVILSSAPKYLDSLNLGDVIVYKPTWTTGTIIHAIKSLDTDAEGWYCLAQGWNNTTADPERIRRSQITHVALGVIWAGRKVLP